jgi:ligand-binding sensor domain-containing protein
MSFAPSNPSIIYLGTSGAGVYKSINGAFTWAPVGLSGQSVWSLAVDPTNPDKVYAAVNSAGGVKTSQNGGLTWQDMPVGTLNVYSLVFSTSTPASLYAGTNAGLYQWVNGSGWVFRGLSGATVTTLAVRSTTPDYLYVGTTLGSYTYVIYSQAWVNGPAELVSQSVQAINFDLNNPSKGYFNTSALGVLLAQIAQ